MARKSPHSSSVLQSGVMALPVPSCSLVPNPSIFGELLHHENYYKLTDEVCGGIPADGGACSDWGMLYDYDSGGGSENNYPSIDDIHSARTAVSLSV